LCPESGDPYMLYNSFAAYLKQTYGEKVYKITVDAGFTCPNIDGTISTAGCIYCNNSAYGAQYPHKNLSISGQIKAGMHYYKTYRNVHKFIVYFQSYTNTYAPAEILRQRYTEALGFDEVVGLAIGTRPDCVDESVLECIEQFSDTVDIWMEYGLQSMHNSSLEYLNRGHTYEQFVHAVERTKGRGLRICVHLILGLPGETYQDMLQTVESVAALEVHGIKLHPLHVLSGTRLENLFCQGRIELFSEKEYVSLVCDILERLPETMVIQRLTADAPDEYLMAPSWCSKTRKLEVIREIRNELLKRGSRQGSELI